LLETKLDLSLGFIKQYPHARYIMTFISNFTLCDNAGLFPCDPSATFFTSQSLSTGGTA
jgi:hypothetical protein